MTASGRSGRAAANANSLWTSDWRSRGGRGWSRESTGAGARFSAVVRALLVRGLACCAGLRAWSGRAFGQIAQDTNDVSTRWRFLLFVPLRGRSFATPRARRFGWWPTAADQR